MGKIMSTGQITIVDLTDERSSSFYLQASQSKIQVYNVTTSTYSPNWAGNESIKITPQFFFGNDDYSAKLSGVRDNTGKLTGNLYYTVDGTEITKYSDTDLTEVGIWVKGNELYIKQNIATNKDTMLICAYVIKNGVQDEKTELKNSENIRATIEFAKVTTGEAGISVTAVEQQYCLGNSSTDAPNEGDTGWGTDNKEWENGKYLWIRTKITYSNGTSEYTSPYCDSSWKTASDAVTSLNGQITTIQSNMNTMQEQIDSAIETWYLEGEPTTDSYPWGDEDPARHVGDLYYDTKTGYSYRFLKDSAGNYTWTRLADSDLTKALEDISGLNTAVNTKVTIFYSDDLEGTKPNTVNDLLINSDGTLYKWSGGTISEGSWIVASESLEYVKVQYATSGSNSTAPTEGWDEKAPAWDEKTYVWQRTVTKFYGKDAITSAPVCISAAAARGVTITGEQAFKSTDGTNYTPTSITLETTLIGGVTFGSWQYKNGNNWTTITGATSASLLVAPTHAAFGTGTSATFKALSSDGNYYDLFTIYKVSDGQSGSDAYSAFLTNENITFSADANGTVAQKTVTTNVVVYKGTEKVTPNIGIISGAPSGMTITKGAITNNEFPITISVNGNLGSAGETSGEISIPITSPITTTLKLTWSKVKTGATGATGAAGADAIFVKVESDGRLVFTDDDDSDIKLTATLYKGGTKLTSTDGVTYSWSAIPSTTELEGTTTTAEITVSRENIVNVATFTCTATYKDKPYSDKIVVSDKTDPVYCVISSSNGDKFTNKNVNTTLTCRLFDGNGEITGNNKAKYTFTWEKYDNKGIKDTNWSAAGESITITSDDVSSKATFTCVVTKKETST